MLLKLLKKESDNQTIGILLCKSKSKIIAEYALRSMKVPIGVSEYTLGAVDNSSDVTRVLCKVQLRMPSHAGGRWPTAGWGDLIIMRSNILKERSRSLRKNMTIAEKKLWAHLRNKQLENVRFRRQVILGHYIIDFLSFDPKIIIEVDGSQHADQVMYDKVRTEYLSSLGYKVLRYWNNCFAPPSGRWPPSPCVGRHSKLHFT